MNRKDIIDQVKQPAIEVMQDRKVLASLLIAESILISEKHKTIEANNPLRLKDSKKDTLLKFDSIEDCFNVFITGGIIESGRENIIGNYNYKSSVRYLKLDKDTENSIIELIEALKLYEIDNEIVKNIYNGKRTIVEIDGEPFIDCYKVRQSFASDKTEILTTFDKDEAIRECKKHYGYSVFNSRGKCIFNNALTPELKVKMELEQKVAQAPKNGSKIYLESVNLYDSPTSKFPIRSITGFYYVCGSKRYNNRYMITKKPEYIGDETMVIGYINDSDRV